MLNITRQYRHLQRYRQIAEILIKNGMGAIVDWLELKKYLPFNQRFSKENDEFNRRNLAERIRIALQELGPTYIKLGQILSTRADIIPPSLIKELRKLQDRVDPVPFSKIEKQLNKELKIDYKSVFKEIKREPQAAASIAQIHRAKLVNGTAVILKIQRPEIEKTVRVDMEILHNLSLRAEEKGLFHGFIKPSMLIREFAESLRRELDFRREMSNMERFRANFAAEDDIIVPNVFKEFTSQRLLVMEEIKGIKLSDIDKVDISKVDKPYLAALGARALMKQVMIDGFFHADPHPGNIFIVGNKKLGYIDFGLMGQLTTEERFRLSVFFVALLKKQINILVDIILEIAKYDEDLNREKFKLEIQELLHQYYGMALSEIKFMVVIDDLQRLLYNFHIQMPEEFFLLFRAIGVSEGVGFTLDPTLDMVTEGNKFINQLLLDRLKPETLIEDLIHKAWEIKKSTRDLPGRFNKLINKLINDDFTIKFKHINLDKLADRIDITSNRLSISLIISALIIGSSMLLQTEMKPQLFGIPLFGFIGYSVAGIMGLWLVISIFRSGKF